MGIQQVAKTVEEFLALNIDDVAAQEQGGLVLRMLATLKSLASTDVYWNAEGERKEKEKKHMKKERQQLQVKHETSEGWQTVGSNKVVNNRATTSNSSSDNAREWNMSVGETQQAK